MDAIPLAKTLKLARGIAITYSASALLPEGIAKSCAYEAVARALVNYDETRGDWESYLVVKIKQEIVDEVRRWHGRTGKKTTVELPENWDPIDLSEDGIDRAERRLAAAQIVRQALDEMRGKRRVVAILLARGWKQPRIARQLGVTKGRVSQIKLLIKKDLQEAVYD